MSEWQTVLFASMVTLGGIFAYLIYLQSKVNKLEKSDRESGKQ